MNLNLETWQEFCLDDLFEIDAGIYHYNDEYEEGVTPYISASNTHNGIAQKIDLKSDFKGNCITTGKIGCTAFYQPNDFCATSDVNVLRAKHFELNEKIGLFIVSIINMSENYKWGYGRQCRVGDSKEIIIKLPVKTDANNKIIIDSRCLYSKCGYIPDFDYMEKYIESLKHKPIKTANKKNNSLEFDIKEWREFRLGNLFQKIYKAKAFVKGELEISSNLKEGYTNFITRTEENNGCDCYVLNEDNKGKELGNAIIIGDTTATCFYQENDFFAGDHIVVCRADWINKYTALFLKSILGKEKYRYSYGRAFKKDLIKNTIVKLPVKNNKPDWGFMENYIKSLPYGDKI